MAFWLLLCGGCGTITTSQRDPCLVLAARGSCNESPVELQLNELHSGELGANALHKTRAQAIVNLDKVGRKDRVLCQVRPINRQGVGKVEPSQFSLSAVVDQVSCDSTADDDKLLACQIEGPSPKLTLNVRPINDEVQMQYALICVQAQVCEACPRCPAPPKGESEVTAHPRLEMKLRTIGDAPNPVLGLFPCDGDQKLPEQGTLRVAGQRVRYRVRLAEECEITATMKDTSKLRAGMPVSLEGR